MDKPTESEQKWLEGVLDRFDFTGEMMWAAPTLAGDDLPDWVENVRLELFQQTWPSVNLKKFGELTAEKAGRLVGQIYANLKTQAVLKEISPEKKEATLKMLKMLEAHRDKPGVASFFQSTEVLAPVLEALSNCVERMENAVHMSLKDALNQSNFAETVEFFQGFSKAIAKPGLINSRPALGTTATSIYNKLFMHWQEVNRLESVPELRRFLIKNGLSEQVLGEPERLEKICERMKLSFRKPGRPRKSKKSDTPAD